MAPMFRRALFAFLCAAPVFLFPFQAAGDWRPVGPFGGPVTALAVDPSNPSTVLAGTARDGVFRSADRGASWTFVAGEGQIAKQIVFDPRHSGTAYALLEYGLVKSTNGGRSWSSVGPSLPGGDSGLAALAIDPRRSILYVGAGDGLFKSTDGGAQWTRGSDIRHVAGLAVDPVSSALYAATLDGLYRSANGGATWRRLSLDAQDLNIISIAPSDSSVLYAGGLYGLYRSTDGGARWRAIHRGLSSPTVTDVAVHPTHPSTLYVAVKAFFSGGTGGLFRSVDGGTHWERMGQSLPAGDVLAVALDPARPSRVYAGLRPHGVFRSADAGRRWSRANAGLSTWNVSRVVVDPERPGTVYAGPMELGLYKTTDAGQSWRIINNRVHGPWAGSMVALDPQQTETVYVSMPRRLERSDDGGATWRRADIGLRRSSFVGVFAIDPSQPSILYAGGAPEIFKSTDRGATWAPLGRPMECNTTTHDLDVSPAAPSTVFASVLSSGFDCPNFRFGLFKSVNSGAQWAPTGAFMHRVVLDPLNPGIIYGVDYFLHLLKSTDGGATFSRLGGEELIVSSLAIDPDDPSILYAGSVGAVYTSADGGAIWGQLGEQLGSDFFGLWVSDIAVDPSTPGRLWAATTRGVFVFDP